MEGSFVKLYLIPIVLGLYIVGYVLYQRLFSPLAKYPGPISASLSRAWITRLSYNGNSIATFRDLHKKYGKYVRVAPNEISIADPKAAREIYGAGSRFIKSDWYSVWQGRRKFDLFPERDEKLHGRERKLVSNAYSMSNVKTLEPYVDDSIEVFFKHMEDLRDTSIDFAHWLQLFAFDVIGEITFSERFGVMEARDDHGTFQAVANLTASASWVGQIPWLYWLHEFLSPYVGNHLAVTQRHGRIRDFATKSVKTREKKGSDHRDMLQSFLDMHDKRPEEFNKDAVVSMSTSNIGAGSDTTATTLRAIIYYLLKNPSCMEKLLTEIDQKKKEGLLSDPVQFNEADGMPYLQAVMYEAMRCHPAVGMLMPRIVPHGGYETDGNFFPAGTTLGANAWVVHLDKEVFGDDAEQFNPDRWLRDDAKELHKHFLSFGGGARLCIGKNISLMEMSKLIPTLLQRYEIRQTDASEEWEYTSYWFTNQTNLNVTINPRVNS